MPALYSIRTKASLLFLFLFILIILPVHFIIYHNTKAVLTDASRKEMLFEAERILNGIRLDPITVPVSINYDIQLAFEEDFQLEVIFASPGFPSVDPALITDAYFLSDTSEFLSLRKTIDGARGNLLLTLVRSGEGLNNRLADNKMYLFVITGISVLLAGALVYLASTRMLKPIHDIATAASRVKASETIERIPVPATRDESQTLAEALNAMLDRIEQTIKNQTNFFASATHELKTPLAIMRAELSSADMMKDERWASMLLEVERLDRVINDFLLVSQLRSDSLSIRKQPCAIDEILYKVLKKITSLNERYKPKIKFHLEDNDAGFVALIDNDKMETVFTNLVENAIKYSFPTELTINLSKGQQMIKISLTNPVKSQISDPQALAKEFKKSKELSDGMGMGLWICNEILKLHDGTMELSSEGLEFCVLISLPHHNGGF